MDSESKSDPFAPARFLRDVVEGLSRPRKAIPGKYLWDEVGSSLFDRICDTRDYYLTRHEETLLAEAAPEIAALVGADASLVEYGSGASRKVRILLDAMTTPRRYVAIDISAEYLAAATKGIAADYPLLEVVPVTADYTLPITLPAEIGDGPTLGFFPGATIGNFNDAEVVSFLQRARRTLRDGWLLIGNDPNRDEATLRRAYGEAEGLMAELHLNVLSHINRVLDADFDSAAFRHVIRVERQPDRVEAHLMAVRSDSYRIGSQTFSFAEGETIHTDTSYKMDVEAFLALAADAGWSSEHSWCDCDGLYALHLLRADLRKRNAGLSNSGRTRPSSNPRRPLNEPAAANTATSPVTRRLSPASSMHSLNAKSGSGSCRMSRGPCGTSSATAR